MRGSPRSLMLSYANTVTGWWTSMAVSVVQRQQRAMLKAMVTPRGRRKATRKKR
jgi:hypothetical protein